MNNPETSEEHTIPAPEEQPKEMQTHVPCLSTHEQRPQTE